MTSLTPRVVYLMVIERIGAYKYDVDDTAIEEAYEDLEDANAAVRKYCSQWDENSLEEREETPYPDGRILIHLEFPEGEQEDISVRKLEVQPSTRNRG